MSESNSMTKTNAVGGTDVVALSSRIRAIENIVQVRGIFERTPLNPQGDLGIHIDVTQAVAEAMEGNRISVLLNLEAVVKSAAPEGEAGTNAPTDGDQPDYVARIVGTYLIGYEIEAGAEPTESQLAEFARGNGLFNVWPFWREYVATSLLRSGLPSLLVPILKLSHNGPKTKSTE
jgi:hypothetical protein